MLLNRLIIQMVRLGFSFPHLRKGRPPVFLPNFWNYDGIVLLLPCRSGRKWSLRAATPWTFRNMEQINANRPSTIAPVRLA